MSSRKTDSKDPGKNYELCWVIPFCRQVVMCADACSANWVESRDVLYHRGTSESQGTLVIKWPVVAGTWSPKCGDPGSG